MTKWADFQTAIQLVAGLNVALYGIPDLREPVIGRERAIEKVLINFAHEKELFEFAVNIQTRFDNHWGRIAEQFTHARWACLIVSGCTTAVLLRASGSGAEARADQLLAWGTILLGFFPSAWLFFLNLETRLLKRGAVALRTEIELDLAQRDAQINQP